MKHIWIILSAVIEYLGIEFMLEILYKYFFTFPQYNKV